MAEGVFLSGLAANACVQATAVTVSSEDAIFPKANLQDGAPWRPFRFGNLAANPKIEFDCNIIRNGNYEADAVGVSPPSSWQTKSGSPDVSSAQANEGTKSMRLDAANEAAFQDREIVPGNTYRLTCALYGDGTNPVNFYVIDLQSGKYWNGTTWGTTKSAYAAKTTTGFGVTTANLTFEEVVAGHAGPSWCRILAERPSSVAGAAYVDSVYMWPKITFAALVYETFPSAFTIAVESDENPSFSSPSAHGNFPAGRFRRYLTFAGPATPERYWRFIATGTPFELFIPWIGQPVLGERKSFITKPSWGLVTTREMPKAGTEEIPSSLSQAPRYRFEMSWESTYAAYRQVAEKMLGACSFGDEPVVIVADTADAEFIYGRGASMGAINPSWTFIDVMQYSLSVQDDPYPVMTK